MPGWSGPPRRPKTGHMPSALREFSRWYRTSIASCLVVSIVLGQCLGWDQTQAERTWRNPAKSATQRQARAGLPSLLLLAGSTPDGALSEAHARGADRRAWFLQRSTTFQNGACPVSTMNVIPGADIIGCGFNTLGRYDTSSVTSRLFITTTDNQRTFTYPPTAISYSVPDNVSVETIQTWTAGPNCGRPRPSFRRTSQNRRPLTPQWGSLRWRVRGRLPKFPDVGRLVPVADTGARRRIQQVPDRQAVRQCSVEHEIPLLRCPPDFEGATQAGPTDGQRHSEGDREPTGGMGRKKASDEIADIRHLHHHRSAWVLVAHPDAGACSFSSVARTGAGNRNRKSRL